MVSKEDMLTAAVTVLSELKTMGLQVEDWESVDDALDILRALRSKWRSV